MKDYAAALLAKLPEMNAKELTHFCLISLSAGNAYTPPHTNSSSDPENPLDILAKLYKVDAHALREKIVTADREKAKAKKATKAAIAGLSLRGTPASPAFWTCCGAGPAPRALLLLFEPDAFAVARASAAMRSRRGRQAPPTSARSLLSLTSPGSKA